MKKKNGTKLLNQDDYVKEGDRHMWWALSPISAIDDIRLNLRPELPYIGLKRADSDAVYFVRYRIECPCSWL
jgi:hypothetical protein